MARSKYNPQRINQARDKVIDSVLLSTVISSYGIDVYGDKIVCPFHNDDNPSCMVSDELKTYHCFGCHAKGTAVEFVRDYERIYGDKNYSQVKAIGKIARDFGVEIPDMADKSLLKPEKKVRIKREMDTKKILDKKLSQVERKARGITSLDKKVDIYSILDEYYFGKITGEEALSKIKDVGMN